jgi:hypothetical protein
MVSGSARENRLTLVKPRARRVPDVLRMQGVTTCHGSDT